jgi:hypothetical protein
MDGAMKRARKLTREQLAARQVKHDQARYARAMVEKRAHERKYGPVRPPVPNEFTPERETELRLELDAIRAGRFHPA